MQDFRPTLLHHILELVPFDGWSDYTFREAASRAGLSEAEATQAFGGGIRDSVRYYFDQIDEQLKKQHPPEFLAALRVHERVETLVMARYTLMLPHREAVKAAASGNLLPWNVTGALKSLYNMTDTIWRLAGDQSTDYNFYTKRMTLAAVHVPTFLFWLNDNSINLEETRRFLKKKLSLVTEFGKKKKSLASRLNAFSYYAKR